MEKSNVVEFFEFVDDCIDRGIQDSIDKKHDFEISKVTVTSENIMNIVLTDGRAFNVIVKEIK